MIIDMCMLNHRLTHPLTHPYTVPFPRSSARNDDVLHYKEFYCSAYGPDCLIITTTNEVNKNELDNGHCYYTYCVFLFKYY